MSGAQRVAEEATDPSGPILKGSIWISKGRRVRVQIVNLARHGEDCASRFVLYTNLEPTEDFAPGERWILGVEAFRSRFHPAPPSRVTP